MPRWTGSASRGASRGWRKGRLPHYVVGVQPPRLIFSDLITEAFRRVTENFRILLDIALVPTIISVVLQLAGRWLSGERPEPLEALIVKLFDFIPATMFAVAWYRLVLLGPGALAGVPGLAWTARERGYLAQLLLISAVPIVLHALFWMLMPWPMEKPGQGQLQPGVETAMPVFFAFVVTLFITLRLSFGLVAPSVDLAWTPHLSWRYGKGNGSTLLFTLLLLLVIDSSVKAMAMLILQGLAEAFFGAPVTVGPWLVATLIVETIAYIAIAPVVTVQAVIFRTLTGWAPGGPLRQPPP